MVSKVSIIVPVYNVEKYIRKCLNSIVNQTYKNIEIIIVNDETKDNSLEICEEFKQQDNRITIISKKNQGLGLARNTGIENATGDYVLFIDGDDYVEEKKKKKTVKLIENNDCDLVRFHNYRENLISGEKTVRKTPLEEGVYEKADIVDKLLLPIIGMLPFEDGNSFVGMSVWRNLYNLNIIKENNIIFDSERIFIEEDILFNIKYLQKIKKAFVINEPLYHYMVNDNSLTGKYNPERFNKEMKLCKEIDNRLKNTNLKGKYEIRLKRKVLDCARMCINTELNRKVERKEKKKKIIEMLNDKEFNQALKEYPINKMMLKYKLVLSLLKYKLIFLLEIVYKIFKKI